ncbi:MAG: hypothetical protein HY922_07030 [Elusimicrobia bacterium]|nr:hypothetical protein [Elusimicrobiota bacterium]
MGKRTALFGTSILVLGIALFSACRPPKYVSYVSAAGDFSTEAPYGWQVFYDADGSDYFNYTFIGPFDADFYRGAPSLSVRWYANDRPHELPVSFEEESFSSGEEYIEKTLREVYGADAFLEQPVHKVEVSGLVALHFVVSSPMPVPAGTRYGVARDNQGSLAVIRQHAYVVVPMDNGFYVLIYPATRAGFPKFHDHFKQFVNKFHALRDGPAGQKI